MLDSDEYKDIEVGRFDPEESNPEILNEGEHDLYWDAGRREGSFQDILTANENDIPTVNNPHGAVATMHRIGVLERIEEWNEESDSEIAIPDYCFAEAEDVLEDLEDVDWSFAVVKQEIEYGDGRHDNQFCSLSEESCQQDSGPDVKSLGELEEYLDDEKNYVVEEGLDRKSDYKVYGLGNDDLENENSELMVKAVEIEEFGERGGEEVEVPEEIRDMMSSIRDCFGLQFFEADFVETSDDEYVLVDLDYTINLQDVEDGKKYVADALAGMARSSKGWAQGTEFDPGYSSEFEELREEVIEYVESC